MVTMEVDANEKKELESIRSDKEHFKENFRHRPYPIWLKTALKEKNNFRLGLALRDEGIAFPMWDHVIISLRELEGKESVVSQPYITEMAQFETLIQFCKKHGLYFFVKGDSQHWSGHTFSIVVYPKKQEEGKA